MIVLYYYYATGLIHVHMLMINDVIWGFYEIHNYELLHN